MLRVYVCSVSAESCDLDYYIDDIDYYFDEYFEDSRQIMNGLRKY